MKKLLSAFLFLSAISSVFAWEGKFVKEGDVYKISYFVITKNDNSLCATAWGDYYGIFTSEKLCYHSLYYLLEENGLPMQNLLHLDSEQSISETIKLMQDHDFLYVE